MKLAEEYRDESTGYVFSNEKSYQGGSNERLSLYAVGCTMMLDLYIPFKNSIQGFSNSSGTFDNAHVRVRFVDGVIRKNASYYPGREPKVKRDMMYEFDVDGRGAEGWMAPGTDILIDPKALAVQLITEFIDFTEANRTW